MKLRYTAVLLALGLGGCAPMITRERVPYESEIKFEAQYTRQVGEVLAAWLPEKCGCEFSSPMCQKAAEILLVTSVRMPWHQEMKLFLAGITDQNPGPEKPFPPLTSLC